MKCNEFERMIPAYLHNELKERQMKQYIEHARTCAVCREEMTIQYLITEGMQRLENGQTLDVERELNEKMNQSVKHLKRVKALRNFIGVLCIAGILCIIAVIVWLVIR